ncbi:MAG: hypothetical protein JNM50_04975 [Chromatiales bacterium]|jgi:hypothetical protein|nr:hypothetical protein [Chromatiales bacterium]
MNLPAVSRYARCIAASRRIRWEIDADVIRGRDFDCSSDFLPASLSMVQMLPFLDAGQRRFFSQVQGRTYANMFGLVERFIGAKIVEVTRDHATGDQVAMEALVRFTDEELKHQELFRRLDAMAAARMRGGYRFVPEPNAVAGFVLGKSTWSVLALTCDIELFTQAHYRASIATDDSLCPLWRDVFLFHWREESQHAILDELEWRRIDAGLTADGRDAAVTDLIALLAGVDGLLQAQATADAGYFATACSGLDGGERQAIAATFLAAYRWQYIHSGAGDPRFQEILADLLTPAQLDRITTALATLSSAPGLRDAA